MRLSVLLLSLLFMSVAVANEGGGEGEAAGGPKYIEMTPKFTVNLAEPKKFLMVNVQLLVDGEEATAAIKKHMPALRNELIMLYSGKSASELQTMQQREALRQETTKVIQETLERMQHGGKKHNSENKEHKSKEGFKEAYFTEFVMN